MAEEEEAGAPLWMCTFSDMMSLLLCFFVLLFSMSTIEKKKWVQATGAFSAAFGGRVGTYVDQQRREDSRREISRKAPPQAKRYYGMEDIVSRLKIKSKTWNLDDSQIEILGTEKGIRFVLMGDALFEEDSAVIRPDIYRAIRLVGEAVIELPSNPIRIIGHTDSSAPDEESFSSNWGLSAARARAVLWQLEADFDIPAGRFRYEGAADTQPREKKHPSPLGGVLYYATDPLDNPNEAAMNRRIEVILMQTDETQEYGWYADLKDEAAHQVQELPAWEEPT